MKQILTLLLFAKKNNMNCQFLLLPKSKIRRLVNTVTPTRWVHCQCFKLFSARRSQVLIENCALLLILVKRIPILKNTGPELSIATVTNVRAINVGDIDRMTDIARPDDITTRTNKVKSGGNGHDTIVVRLVVSTCVVTNVNGRGMSPGSVPAVLRNLILRPTNGTRHSKSNVMKISSDNSDNCKRKLRINSKGHRVTFQIRVRHPFLQCPPHQCRPHVCKVKGT